MALQKGRGPQVDNSFGILGRVVGISVRKGIMSYLLGMRARILGVILVIMCIRC